MVHASVFENVPLISREFAEASHRRLSAAIHDTIQRKSVRFVQVLPWPSCSMNDKTSYVQADCLSTVEAQEI